mmetsp:Transcript_26042/g.43298  ORF Transcript_26042/g.43298 Transcript_26042/m.43298 type:complete len:91 (-) Transcript_26042:776-1048(-)
MVHVPLCIVSHFSCTFQLRFSLGQFGCCFNTVCFCKCKRGFSASMLYRCGGFADPKIIEIQDITTMRQQQLLEGNSHASTSATTRIPYPP